MEYRQAPNPEAPMDPPRTLCSEQEYARFDRTDHDRSSGEMKQESHFSPALLHEGPSILCDPEAVLSNLSFLEQKIHQVQHAVRSIMSPEEQSVAGGTHELAMKQQLMAADLTSIIIQLISTAGTLLPSLTGGSSITGSSAGLLSSPPALAGFNAAANVFDGKDLENDARLGLFSPVNFDSFNFGGDAAEFPQPAFDAPDGSFPFFSSSMFGNYARKGGDNSTSN